MLTKESAALLGLSNQEYKIWKTLQNGSLNVTNIALKTDIPRTSLYGAIATLKRRGFMSSRKKGRDTFITLLPHQEIQEKFEKIASEFNTVSTKEISLEDSRLTVFKGRKALINLFAECVKSHPGERFRAIQTTRSLISAISHGDPQQFVPLNNAIKEYKVIAEALLQENFFHVYLNHFKGKKDIQKSIADSFLGRMADVVLVDKHALKNNCDFVLMSDCALLMNWEKDIAIKITNKEILETFSELLDLARGYGRKIDFNEHVKKVIQETTTP